MKNKYKTYNYDDIDYKDYGKYVNITDYIKEYNNQYWSSYEPETEEERLSRQKSERINSKIDQILR